MPNQKPDSDLRQQRRGKRELTSSTRSGDGRRRTGGVGPVSDSHGSDLTIVGGSGSPLSHGRANGQSGKADSAEKVDVLHDDGLK